MQALGLLRWVMLVPSLAAAYVAPGATAGLFDAMNHYLGAGVGEHLGYLFTGASTVMVSALIWTQWRPLAVAGALIALGSVAGMAEPFGVPMTSMINALSFSLWALGRSYSASWCCAASAAPCRQWRSLPELSRGAKRKGPPW